MLLPSKCPICSDPLINKFLYHDDRFITKSCSNKLNHKVVINSNTDYPSAFSFTYNNINALWEYHFKTLTINKVKFNWVEPDLYNGFELIQTVKRFQKLLTII